MRITSEIASKVGGSLGTAEQTLTAAVRDGATMLATLSQGGLDAKLPVGVLSGLITESIQSLAQIAAAGETYAGLHSRLSVLARKAGLEPSMYGWSLQNYPPSTGQIIPMEERREAA